MSDIHSLPVAVLCGGIAVNLQALKDGRLPGGAVQGIELGADVGCRIDLVGSGGLPIWPVRG